MSEVRFAVGDADAASMNALTRSSAPSTPPSPGTMTAAR